MKAVFFDAGHTLIASRPDVAGIYRQAAEACGVVLDSPEDVVSVLRTVYSETTARVMKTAVNDEADKDMWRCITRDVYDALPEMRGVAYEPWFEHIHDVFVNPDTWHPYEETADVLDSLRALRLRLAVISNWSSNLPHILEHIGLAEYFDDTVVSCIEGFRKPDPQLFEVALKRLGIAPQDALHVGDTLEDDVLGAADAGIRGVLVDRGGHATHDCTIIRDLRGVLDIIQG